MCRCLFLVPIQYNHTIQYNTTNAFWSVMIGCHNTQHIVLQCTQNYKHDKFENKYIRSINDILTLPISPITTSCPLHENRGL